MWGASLWLTLGEKMAAGTWLPSSNTTLPPSLASLLAYAAGKGVKLNPCALTTLADPPTHS